MENQHTSTPEMTRAESTLVLALVSTSKETVSRIIREERYPSLASGKAEEIDQIIYDTMVGTVVALRAPGPQTTILEISELVFGIASLGVRHVLGEPPTPTDMN